MRLKYERATIQEIANRDDTKRLSSRKKQNNRFA